ncbi:PEGA domain-containing protein [Candidatus Poribacteria bacterium]|jgi:hypothetical protein|nr:PEGA domain-containing protein [Candidatus Poribacteria bacterium]MBT5531495.1 PEGA domain-containing protein [Candidatus Poribacteria bacterium]MBT5714797.1 PEGA domain-containing protein [Candidatus Poribacteria bacterium]MBT7099788.1 PEGA domain-containing protein [Candidatus Poribacteria bacterium]MBT7805633.1 PEGA domain-containing protein [Candidatus Poribacteria bacterium]
MVTATSRRRALFALGAFAVAFILAEGALAQDSKTLRVEAKEAESLMQDAVGPEVGSKWALLIGINRYEHPVSGGFNITPLKVAVRDAHTLSQFLTNPTQAGFPPEQVFTLTDEAATKRNILLTLNDIVMKAGDKDLVLIYFSGHGFHDQKRDLTYLLPFDAEMQDASTTCIALRDLRDKFDDLSANKVVTILDACHSGGIKIQGTKGVEESPYQYYLDAFEQAEGRPMLLSSDQSEVSWEMANGQNSVFTHFLIKGMSGDADFDGDGVVGFSEASRYVEQRVPEYTRANGLTAQRPTRRDTGGTIRGDIPLAFDLDTLVGIRDTLDGFAERLRTLRSISGAGQLAAQDVERITQYALHVKEWQLRRRRVAPEDFEMLGLIDKLIDGAATTSEYRTEQERIYPGGLPSAEELAATGNGTLLIRTGPIGAAIYVDGQFRAYAPKRLLNLPAGRRRVRLVLPGHAAYEQVVMVRDDESVKVSHDW